MLMRFAEVPLMIHFWGVDLLGEWLIITALPTYLAISDFGFAHVTARQVVIQAAGGNTDEALATYQSSSVLVGLMSSIIALCFLVIVAASPAKEAFSIERLSHSELLAIAVLMGLKIVVSLQTGMLGNTLQAVGRYALFFMLMTGIAVAEFLLFALTVCAGGGPVPAAGVMLIATLVGLIVTFLTVRHLVAWFDVGFKFCRLEIVRQLARPAFAALAFPASQALNAQGLRLVIGSTLGPAAVALFSAHRQLAAFVTRTNVFGRSVNVELGLAYGTNDLDSFRRLTLQVIRLLSWVALLAAAAIGMAAWFVFPLWVGKKMDFSPYLFGLLLLAAVFDVMWRAAFTPAEATNKHLNLARAILPINAIMLGIAYLLCSRYGLAGAATAVLAGGGVSVAFAIRNAAVICRATGLELLAYVFRPPTDLLLGRLNKPL